MGKQPVHHELIFGGIVDGGEIAGMAMPGQFGRRRASASQVESGAAIY